MTVMVTLMVMVLASAGGASGLGVLPPPAGPEQWYAGNACIQCHVAKGGRLAEIVEREWATSIHYEQNVPCESCHGGDASLTRGQFSSEEEFTKASHLSFRPEFLFLRDRVGIGMAQETTVSFVCRECHGQTIEQRRGDPHSGVEVRPCLFSRYGGISMTRGRGIAYVCAKCHAVAAEKHLASPHGSFGAPSCLFCHGAGSHAIPQASLDVLDSRPREELGRCSPCHKPTSTNVVAQIKEAFERVNKSMEVAVPQFDELQRMGYRNLALSEMHAHLDEIKSRLREVQHGCNIRDINELAKSIEHVARHTAYDHELVVVLRAARQRQTKAALGTAGLLLVLVAMLAAYKRAFCEKGGAGPLSALTRPAAAPPTRRS